ncbi:MAG: gamma-glutamylcyclotransferase [SAR324 cluster bacterium]|nr:gamma-glutamylcyclotransferase [SAR324 cluster bacterium]
MEEHYIFGYGSLINHESRAKTGYSGSSIPVRVQGVARSWNQVSAKSRICSVGVTLQNDATCNGVLFPVSEKELPKFDLRESHYERVMLESKQIFPWDSANFGPGKFWTYLLNKQRAPSQQCPIAQSYIDVAMSGCLEINEAFAEEFVSTTRGWCPYMINDRSNPQYRMPMKEVPFAELIDQILKSQMTTSSRKSIPA